MNDDELGRTLHDAFDAQARAAVHDDALPPPPRFEQPAKRHWGRLLAPLAAAAAVLAVVGSVLALRSSGHGHERHTAAASKPVQIKVATADKSYGVGMPVVAYFSRRFNNAKPLASATTISINGKPAHGAWYFERSSVKGYPIAGHLRMPKFWPAHSDVRVTIRANELTARASINFHTGARTIAVVLGAKHRMIVSEDGKQMGTYPVSLGTSATPTSRGTKVIMAKLPIVRLRGPGYDERARYAQQLTDTGEYLIAAPWNAGNIERGFDSSSGCTNLLPHNARFLYKVLNVGDVVEYLDTNGPMMSMQAGLGDWNVPWRVWVRGGLIPIS